MTEQIYEGHEILDNNLFSTTTSYRMVKNVYNIVLFLIAADLFSKIIVSKFFCIWFFFYFSKYLRNYKVFFKFH